MQPRVWDLPASVCNFTWGSSMCSVNCLPSRIRSSLYWIAHSHSFHTLPCVFSAGATNIIKASFLRTWVQLGVCFMPRVCCALDHSGGPKPILWDLIQEFMGEIYLNISPKVPKPLSSLTLMTSIWLPALASQDVVINLDWILSLPWGDSSVDAFLWSWTPLLSAFSVLHNHATNNAYPILPIGAHFG